MSWAPALAVALFIGVPTVIFLVVALNPEKTEEEKLRDDLVGAFRSYWEDYSIPAIEAASQVQHLCEYVQPDPSVTDCDRYVQKLAELNGDLQRASSRLSMIDGDMQQRASRMPLSRQDYEGLGLMDDLADLVELQYETDRILIEGWNNRDYARWREGWDLRRQIIDDFRALSDAYQGYRERR